MALARFEVAVAADSVLPRDRVVNVLHFNIQEIPLVSGDPDLEALCSDLAGVYKTIWHNMAAREIVIKAYDQEGTKPVYPATTFIQDAGIAPTSPSPREVALCLSYYADRNVPRRRGRIYLCMATSSFGSLNVRPTGSHMDKVLEMAQGFKDLGGADVDWQIWSTRDDTGYNVSDAWVDDEWDTMRSRGMRSTTRQTAHIGE